ncbi:hypothetical protein BMF89_00240 [Arthrobacter sp. SRS-W-1-2016]|uniref:hypothetical protein n=1 Tax=Arthrobacter sp. SRS-W-1-2016 TaxID=1930254 RepID=UPI000990D880|nr:hypothetical protein [Arthrobacter sp. SRS-W-1-2016]OOP65311.1 hypothetical protein BMF89_00240 [Arthrobacter sp. SRS-W-1-2016]
MKKAIFAFISASILLLAAPLAASASSVGTSAGAAGPAVANSYSPLAAKWWVWALSQPASSNPLLDTTGSQCANQQSGPTWFLAGLFNTGGSVTRSCTVPAHIDLFFPLANSFDIEPQSAHETPAFVRSVVAQAGVQNGASNLTVTFDGSAVGPGVVKYEESSIFKVALPTDNIFGDPTLAGVYEPGADAGYYALIQDVLPGTHTLNFTGTLNGQTINSTYALTVTP